MDNYFCFKDKKIPLFGKTYVMGILNITPDSFSDGGRYSLVEDAVLAAKKMEQEGADFIDIGGQSTRPGAIKISEEQEWKRLQKVLPAVLKCVDIPISVDTFYPEVAKKALSLGCHIINDVSGTVSPEMAEVVKQYSAGWCLMHNAEEETEDIVETVHNRLLKMLNQAILLGVKRENICLDAGIGFGKTMEQNRLLIKETQRVMVEGVAYLLGASRKRIIGFPLLEETKPNQRDFGTTAADTVGILGGANIIRVHNCRAAVQAARVSDYILRGILNDK